MEQTDESRKHPLLTRICTVTHACSKCGDQYETKTVHVNPYDKFTVEDLMPTFCPKCWEGQDKEKWKKFIQNY